MSLSLTLSCRRGRVYAVSVGIGEYKGTQSVVVGSQAFQDAQAEGTDHLMQGVNVPDHHVRNGEGRQTVIRLKGEMHLRRVPFEDHEADRIPIGEDTLEAEAAFPERKRAVHVRDGKRRRDATEARGLGRAA